MQFSDLLHIHELDVYVASFGSPQVLAVSRDFVHWHPIIVEGYDTDYNYHTGLLRVGERVIGWTGNSVASIALREQIPRGTAYHKALLCLHRQAQRIFIHGEARAMTKILVVSEMYWPEGSGGILATHLVVKTLKSPPGFELTAVHGSSKPDAVNGVRYIYPGLLSARDKFRLWLNCLRLAREGWFLDLLKQHDVLYIPKYCYPLIPVAKRLGKRVVVHLHDYQPISYNANIPAPTRLI